jgi:hypothetical protein
MPRPLRHRVDDATLARIRARIHESIVDRTAPKPTVAEIIAVVPPGSPRTRGACARGGDRPDDERERRFV